MHMFLRTALLAASLAPLAVAQTPGCFDLNIGSPLGLLDDDTAQGLALGFTFNYGGVAYTDVCVCSNGYIWLGATSVTGGDFSPTTAELLSGAPRICPGWMDLNPSAAGSGNVHYNTVPGSPAKAIITYNNCYEFGTTNPVQMQVVLDDTGTIQVSYGANAPIGGTASGATQVVIGASTGLGATANPVIFSPLPLNVTSDTFHEELPNPLVWPYSNVSMTWTPLVPGYAVLPTGCTPNNLPGPAQFSTFGTGCPNTAGLGAGDDTTHAVSLPFPFAHTSGTIYNDIVVSSNGFLTLGTVNGGSGCCSGNVATMLAGQPMIAGLWEDLNCSDTSSSGNGDIYTHSDPATGDFIVTWFGVGEFGVIPPPSLTFQVALGPAGDIKMRFVDVGHTPGTAVVGYSDGLGAADPGPTDLSAITAPPTVNTIYEVFDTVNLADLNGLDFLLLPSGTGYTVIPGAAGPFVTPDLAPQLSNGAGSLPVIGGTQTLDVTGVPATTAACLLALSFIEANPPIDLVIVGAPGCNSYLDFLTGGAPLLQVAITAGAPTASYALNIPNNASLAGTVLLGQAVVPDPAFNAVGLRFSNGARMSVGL